MTLLAPGAATAAAPSGARRLLAASSPALADHLAAFGPVRTPGAVQAGAGTMSAGTMGADALIRAVADAGLTGRGGAAFPVARKLAAVRDAGRPPVVVANGSEGEPLSAKDRTLLAQAPHLVIDGLLVAAAALGAREAHLQTDPALLPGLERAISERQDAAGIRLRAVRGGFVAGEASAVVQAIERDRPVPRDHPVRLSVRGVRRAPTLVQNVETLAHVALIARYGGAWFREVGTDDDPGTRLVSVSEAGGAPRVLEAAGGTPIAALLASAGIGTDCAALLVGGYHGTWVPSEAVRARFGPAGLGAWGASPGAGIVATLPAGACGLRATADAVGWLAAASAGQCGPCVNGLPHLAGLVRQLADRDTAPGLTDEIRRVAALVDGRGACHHPDGTVRMVASALVAFADDVHAHAAGRCLAATPSSHTAGAR